MAKSKKPTPAAIRLTHPYAYYDENEQLVQWHAGQQVSDENEIANLMERGAQFEEISNE